MSAQPLTKIRLVTLVAGLFVLTALSWHRLTQEPAEDSLWHVAQGQTMGTTYAVKWRDSQKGDLQQRFDETLEAVNQSMSTYRPDSELSQFNQADTAPVTLEPDLYHVIWTALEINKETNGAFDITVGPIVNAYGFGPDLTITSPDDSTIEALRAYVGSEHLRLDTKTHQLQKAKPEVYCDLSAIAKGYGVDRVAGFLELCQITDYFVEVGGEVRAHGVNPDGQPWRVGIETPIEDERSIHRAISLTNQAMATSGSYRNYVDVDGQRLSHTIDPRTARPVTHRVVSATVIHGTCERADAYATALMVLGEKEGLAFAEKQGLAVLLIVQEEDGTLREVMSRRFEWHLENTTKTLEQ